VLIVAELLSSYGSMALVCGVGILLADQWSKYAILKRHGKGQGARLRFVPHRHGAYQSKGGRLMLLFTWLIALVSTSTLSYLHLFFQLEGSRAGLGLALGGAASNLLDIVRYRYVIDYIDLGWWPVFNLADVAIVIGLPMALLY
jgi:signal peptidase II